jgi:Carboxypeptidase regulatory-like domain/TonB-dependent Receptor Plug Domain
VHLRLVVALLVIAAIAGGAARGATAQGVTGQVAGVVVDGSGSLVPGAAVTIVNTGTSSRRHTVTAGDGAFVFVDLLAGTYDLAVALEGFKTIEQKGVTVAATERVTTARFVLEIGGRDQTVTVRGDVPLVQTATSARSAFVTREQIETTPLKGRDILGMLSLIPGVVDTNPREAPSWNLLFGLTINGRASFNLTYDGVNNKETESNFGNLASPALDSIAEVRVQTSNFQAEYGRSSGASITILTRSGSKDFRGSAAFYKRDTSLNGNEFSRKQQCGLGDQDFCTPALYRFDNYAWTLGGPVLVPGTGFNSGRNRLFFFWSQDILRRTDPGALIQRRMPTALERRGDFSQTFDTQGRVINIRDPLVAGNCSTTGTRGPACFPGNVIPADRIDATGQAILNLLPLPNASDPTGRNQYNYTFQMVNDWPRDDQVLRLDWNAGPRTTVYGRVQFGYENRSGLAAPFGFTGFFPRMASKFETEAISYVNTLLHTIDPTTFLEVTAGVNWGYQHASPLGQAALDANTRSRVLPGFPAILPAGNPLDLVPNASFAGGIPALYAPILMYERRFPFSGYSTLWNFTGSLTKILGPHNIKTGIFVEHATRPVERRSAYNGNLNFGVDSSHPSNTNMGFANALLGTVASYQKADKRPAGHAQFVITEFYAQDNWRVGRRLTLDAGVRFHYMTPTRSRGDQVAQFEPSRFDSVAAPLLFEPVRTPQGTRGARNPVTGQDDLPAGYIGRPVPGSGDLVNGTQVYDGTPHRRSPFTVAPRAGFAWNVTGDGRSAIRGGVGVFYERYGDNDILELLELPPIVRTYTVNHVTMADLSSPVTETTSAARRIEEFVPPVVYNWSLGAQREVGWNVVGDVAYVGNAARHQPISRELNGRPYGYAYQPGNLDATNVIPNLPGGQPQPLPDDLLRPYRGYSSITQREFTGYANYHSVQVMLTRRHSADGLSGGVAYTYQIVNRSLGAIDPFLADNRARHYNSAGRRPHTLTLHYSYRLPEPPASTPAVLKPILEGWQISGVTSMLSGAQGGFAYTYSNVNGALSGNGSIGGGPNRPRIICDPYLPRSERTFDRQFRTECLAAPDDPFHFGTARGDEFHGPGFVNWDVSAFKHISLGGTRRLQLRVELYNAFNTYQWTAVNTTAEFDYRSGALTNPAVFGGLTGATNSARRIQLAARFTF